MKNRHSRQNVPHSDVTNVLFRLIGAMLLATLVTACATTPPAKSDIKVRAQARWNALLAGDLDTAYSYFSPGYRSSTTRDDFEVMLRLRRIYWTSAEVQESSCEADVCTVSTRLGYEVKRPVPGVSEWKNKKLVDEKWLRTGGEWWFMPPE